MVAEAAFVFGGVDVLAVFVVALDVVALEVLAVVVFVVVVVVAFFCGAGDGCVLLVVVVALGAGFDADSTYGSDHTGPKTMAVAAIRPTSACSHLICVEDFMVRRGTACIRCTPLVSLSDAGVRCAIFGNNLN